MILGHVVEPVWRHDQEVPGGRWHAFIGGLSDLTMVRSFELCVYDSGIWYVFDLTRCTTRASGTAPSVNIGKERALAAYKLVRRLCKIEDADASA